MFAVAVACFCFIGIATEIRAGEVKPLEALPAKIKEKLPSVINVGNLPVGAPGVVQTMAVSDAISKDFGLSLKCRPYSSDVAKYKAYEAKDIASMYTSVGSHQYYLLGLELFHGWKPKKTRVFWHAFPVWAGAGVAGNIDNWGDLPGKRWAYPAYGPGHLGLMLSYFAYHKIDPNSLTKVPASSYTKAIEMVKDGQADIALITVTCPKTTEAVSLGKMKILGFGPPDEKEAWARLRAITPGYGPRWADLGCVKENPLWMSGGSYGYQALDDLDENLVYALTYGFHKTYPKWKDVSLEASYASLEETLNINNWKQLGIPFHRGAIKYFKDIGAWTAEHEAYQDMAEILEGRVFDVREAWLNDLEKK